LGHLIGDGNALVGQLLESFEVADVLLDLGGLAGGHTPAELFAFVKPLEDEIGALSEGLAIPPFGVNLAAEAAPAEAVDALKLGQKRSALGGELINRIWHGVVVSIWIQQCKQKIPAKRPF